MKTQTNTKSEYCPQEAVRYARVLYELKVSKEAIQKTKDIFEEVPKLRDVFVNPTIRQEQKLKVIDQVFPAEIRNFLKVTCRYQKMDMIEDIFVAYKKYCEEQEKVLNAVLTCVEPPSEAQMQEMKAFLCKKYDALEVNIDIRKDETLLGGFVLLAGSDEYDWSLRGRLNRLEQKLTWR